jgi:hypothetical protein
MVNFKDPATIAQDYGAYAISLGSGTSGPIYQLIASTVAVVKLWHFMDGVLM